MNMLQRPGNTLLVLSVGTILATSALVTLEASQLGVGSRLDDRGQLSESPIWWFLGCTLLWALAFPRYLDARKRYGQSSLLWAGIGGVVVFLVSWFWMQDIVADRTQELIRTLQKF